MGTYVAKTCTPGPFHTTAAKYHGQGARARSESRDNAGSQTRARTLEHVDLYHYAITMVTGRVAKLMF